MINGKTISKNLELVREKKPLVHNITNYVVMNNTANALLALGASPVMAHAVEEVKDMAAIASALVINIGTLSPRWVEGMLIAGKTAKQNGTPVIFDPVGVGATPYRNEVAKQILKECQPDFIRGNGSEIMALTNQNVSTKGVDSSASSNSALDAAKTLANQTGAVVIISGQEDFITDGTTTSSVQNGSTMMTKVTGMGCTATAVLGAFAAINSDKIEAATSAMAVMSIAGEIAVQQSAGPGSLQLNFLDVLYNLDAETVEKTAKMVTL